MGVPRSGATRFIVTVDDPGGLIQDISLFRRAREFFDSEGVPATFFVVPKGENDWRLDRQDQWSRELKAAMADGHDCQLHGLTHGHCEFGPYPWFVYGMGTDDWEKQLAADTEAYGASWRRELFVPKLQEAMEIFRQGLGQKPQVFRGGAASFSTELYEAMMEVGLRYASNTVVDPRGWRYIAGKYDDPGDWDPEVPPRPYRMAAGVVGLPLVSEYAWYLTPDKLPIHLALALDDLQRVYAQDGIFIPVCHVQLVGAEDPLARKLLHELFAVARREYQVSFETLRNLVADIEAGVVPVG